MDIFRYVTDLSFLELVCRNDKSPSNAAFIFTCLEICLLQNGSS